MPNCILVIPDAKAKAKTAVSTTQLTPFVLRCSTPPVLLYIKIAISGT